MKTDTNLKYKKGDKVILISKYNNLSNLENSDVYKILKKRKQPYGFVTDYIVKKNVYIVSEDKFGYGDYFNESDLILYLPYERKQKLLNLNQTR